MVDGSENVNVYPNPITGRTMNIQYTSNMAGNCSVTFISTNGVKWILQMLKLQEGKGSMSVNLPPNLPAGFYYIRFVLPGGMVITKQINLI